MTKPSMTWVRTCGLTKAFGRACLPLDVGVDTEFAGSSVIPLVIEFTALAKLTNGLFESLSSGLVAVSSLVDCLDSSIII